MPIEPTRTANVPSGETSLGSTSIQEKRRITTLALSPDDSRRASLGRGILAGPERAALRSTEALVQTIDELGHLLELVGDEADPALAEVLRLHAERLRETGQDFVRGHRPVAVHD